jgi:hypothetical protein
MICKVLVTSEAEGSRPRHALEGNGGWALTGATLWQAAQSLTGVWWSS